MEVFGSPTAVERAPPLILFVVDLAKASERISLESHLSAIELAIVRTLLFQFLHVDNRLSWTYQLFDSRIGTVNSISPQKYPSEFSFESLNDFHTALTKYARDFGPEKTLDIPLLSNVSRSLERAMQDMKWDWNDHIARVAGALLSPPQLVKNPTLSGAQRSFKIRNQLILISHAFPNTTEDLLSFVHGNQSPKMTAESDTNSFAECVKEIQGTFFGHSNRMSRLWTLLIEKRASLSILGFGKTEINQPDETNTVQSALHSMIQATGGSFVTGDLLVSRNALLSSAAFLRLFRSKLASGLFQKSFHFDLFSEERLLHKLQVSGSDTNIKLFSFPNSLSSKDTVHNQDLSKQLLSRFSTISIIKPFQSQVICRTWLDEQNHYFVTSSLILKLPFLTYNRGEILLIALRPEESDSEDAPIRRLAIVQEWNSGSCIVALTAEGKDFDVLSALDGDIESESIPAFRISDWTATIKGGEMENVILNGKSPSGITYEEAQRLSLDIWEPSLIERLESSKPKIEDANMFDVSHQRSETTVTELPEESAPTFNTAQESLQSLLHSYVNLIYGEKNIGLLLSETLPPVYSALSELLDPEADPVVSMVKFLAQEIIQDVTEIDRKGDFLMSLEPDKLENMLEKFKIGKYEKSILGNWLNNFKKIMGERKLWKEAVQQVKCRQAKLQVITLLECLRLQAETDVPLPRLKCMDPATKGKGKKRAKLDKPVPVEMYKTLVNLYVDRICIWSALQIGEDAPYNTFVEPILQNYYETSLPGFVGSIVAKFEPENKQQSILESPVFKKTRTVNRKVSSAKRKKAPEDIPSEDKKSKSNSIWEKLSKRALPLRKGSKKAAPVANKTEKSALTKSHSLTENDRKVMHGLESFRSPIQERILVLVTPQKPKSPFMDMILKS